MPEMPTTPQHENPQRPGRRGRGRRRKPVSTRRKLTRGAVWGIAAVLVAGGAGAGIVYAQLDGNITGVDIDGGVGDDRPKNVDNGSMDVLVMGSDSRSGKNSKYGKDEGGARSDTAMVLHIDKGRKTATAVSIPRDTLVKRPDCTREGGGTVPGGERQMFNTAYEVGGPACAVKTVESLSGIRMDHYLEVDFTGFKQLIDDLGGVDVTTRKAIDDPNSHLQLAAGKHTLDGEQSLGLVRTRHAVGDGSDLSRIQLQQAFVKALIAQVRQVGVLDDPRKLYNLADTATDAVTTDEDLASVSELTGLARSLNGIDEKGLHMLTLPVEYDPDDPQRVLPRVKQDRQVWAALKADRRVPGSVTEGSVGDTGEAGSVVAAG